MPIALVTGGAIRVGRAISLALAHAGFDLLIHVNRSRDEADRLAKEVTALGRQASVIQCDLSAPTGPKTLASQVTALDLLVNSAAIYEHVNFLDVTAEQLEKMFRVNLFAPFLLTQALVPVLRNSKTAAVVNITDMAVSHAYTTSHFFPHYLAAKAGLDQLTRAWALELGPQIRVNAVAPGAVAMAAETTDAQKIDMLARIPLKREGTPADIGNAVVFLALSPYVNGQTIRVDGGLSVA